MGDQKQTSKMSFSFRFFSEVLVCSVGFESLSVDIDHNVLEGPSIIGIHPGILVEDPAETRDIRPPVHAQEASKILNAREVLLSNMSPSRTNPPDVIKSLWHSKSEVRTERRKASVSKELRPGISCPHGVPDYLSYVVHPVAVAMLPGGLPQHVPELALVNVKQVELYVPINHLRWSNPLNPESSGCRS